MTRAFNRLHDLSRRSSIRGGMYAIALLLTIYVGFQSLTNDAIANFITVFVSILLEAFPFILLGTLISSTLHLFVTPTTIARILPSSKLKGLLAASVAGFAFPICECANVPVTRRLVEKEMPTHIAITFLLSVAIVNPIVLFSTWIAFGGNMRIVLIRGGLGIFIALFTGWVISLFPSMSAPLRKREAFDECQEASSCGCGHDHQAEETHHNCECSSDLGKASPAKTETLFTRFTKAVYAVLNHTGDELYMVGRFMIMGAAIASLMQTILPRAVLIGIGMNPFFSVVALMILAYLLSLCSEADAFIAATFTSFFTPGAIIAFLVFGPMVDIKNTLMMLDAFKPKFTLKIILIVIVLVLAAGLTINGLVNIGVQI